MDDQGDIATVAAATTSTVLMASPFTQSNPSPEWPAGTPFRCNARQPPALTEAPRSQTEPIE